MKEFAKLFAVCSALFMAGCASGPNVASAARAELVSTGQLRVGLILSNQVLVTKNLQTGELEGVAVALGKAHVFPDTNSQGLGEQPQWLYTVVFEERKVWGNLARPQGLKVSVDAWEPYLEPFLAPTS